VDDFIDRLPQNVHIFFVSDLSSDSDRTAALGGLQERVDAALAALPSEDADWWQARFHYLVDRSIEQPGWLGDVLLSPRFPIAIDRFQRIRYVGSFGDYTRAGSREPFEPNLAMVANEPVYYNFEALKFGLAE